MDRRATTTKDRSIRNPTTTNTITATNPTETLLTRNNTHESKIEKKLDQVLQGQQQLTVDFNGKIDAIYTNLNTKFNLLKPTQADYKTTI